MGTKTRIPPAGLAAGGAGQGTHVQTGAQSRPAVTSAMKDTTAAAKGLGTGAGSR